MSQRASNRTQHHVAHEPPGVVAELRKELRFARDSGACDGDESAAHSCAMNAAQETGGCYGNQQRESHAAPPATKSALRSAVKRSPPKVPTIANTHCPGWLTVSLAR